MQTRTDDVYVGRYFGHREHDLTPALVGHYCQSIGEESPHSWYTGPTPFGGPVVPAMLLHSDVYRFQGWYLPNIYGNLHARQEWEFFYPMMVGQSVTTRSIVVDRYIKRDREYVVNEVTCFDSDGRPLNRGRTHQSFLLQQQPAGMVVDKDRERRGDRRFDVGQVEILEEIAGPERAISLEMCQAFSGPAKNYHTDREAARALGFPDIVVQGMMPLCFLSEMMTHRFEAGWLCGGRMNVALVNVLWQGEIVRTRGVIHELRPEGSRQRANLQVWVEKADGTKVVIGTASAVQ